LEGRFRLPVRLLDERFSSTSADERLRAQGLDWRARKAAIDAEAAAILLQDYFDQGQHASP
jgi:putative Holliday junction resolvase